MNRVRAGRTGRAANGAEGFTTEGAEFAEAEHEFFSLGDSYSALFKCRGVGTSGRFLLPMGKSHGVRVGAQTQKPLKNGGRYEASARLTGRVGVGGLVLFLWGYFLFGALWHSGWLNGHNDVLPMFLSIITALGVCLLVAVKRPAKHRSLIAYAAWSSLAHAFTMTIQSAQAAAHGMHRSDSPGDIVVFGAIGVALLVLLPAKQQSPDGAAMSEPRFAER